MHPHGFSQTLSTTLLPRLLPSGILRLRSPTLTRASFLMPVPTDIGPPPFFYIRMQQPPIIPRYRLSSYTATSRPLQYFSSSPGLAGSHSWKPSYKKRRSAQFPWQAFKASQALLLKSLRLAQNLLCFMHLPFVFFLGPCSFYRTTACPNFYACRLHLHNTAPQGWHACWAPQHRHGGIGHFLVDLAASDEQGHTAWQVAACCLRCTTWGVVCLHKCELISYTATSQRTFWRKLPSACCPIQKCLFRTGDKKSFCNARMTKQRLHLTIPSVSRVCHAHASNSLPALACSGGSTFACQGLHACLPVPNSTAHAATNHVKPCPTMQRTSGQISSPVQGFMCSAAQGQSFMIN